MKKVNVHLQLAQKRAGKKALKRSIISSIKIAGAVIIGGMILLFSIGYTKELAILALPLEGLALFIPFRIMSTVYSARKNSELIRKELENIARTEEFFLLAYKKYLAESEAALRRKISYEDAEAATSRYLQQEKEDAVRLGEKGLALRRKNLTEATPQNRLAHQDFFLQEQQKLREEEGALEMLRNATFTESTKRSVHVGILKLFDLTQKQLWEPRVLALQTEIAYAQRLLQEIRQLLSEL